MKIFSKYRAAFSVASIGAILSLAACGGGGDSSGDGAANPNAGGPPQAVSGTVAKGAALAGAAVSMTCANGAVLGGTTSATGGYTTASVSIAYPCIGTAVGAGGSPSYRGVMFSGGVANFSPLTEMLVQTVLAASASGTASLTLAEFVTKMSTDATFSTNVSAPANVTAYRTVVLNTVTKELSATKTPAEITLILAAASTFDATPFVIGSPLDKVLDNTASVLQNTDGSIKTTILASVKVAADVLPVPPSKATGAAGS